MRRNKETEKEIIKLFEDYRLEDFPSIPEEHLKWLREAGFKTADCIFKYNHFAVFYAEK